MKDNCDFKILYHFCNFVFPPWQYNESRLVFIYKYNSQLKNLFPAMLFPINEASKSDGHMQYKKSSIEMSKDWEHLISLCELFASTGIWDQVERLEVAGRRRAARTL